MLKISVAIVAATFAFTDYAVAAPTSLNCDNRFIINFDPSTDKSEIEQLSKNKDGSSSSEVYSAQTITSPTYVIFIAKQIGYSGGTLWTKTFKVNRQSLSMSYTLDVGLGPLESLYSCSIVKVNPNTKKNKF